MLLQQNGCDVNNYRACCGNQIQQLVHQDCLILLEQIADISPLSYIYEHKNSFVQCIDAARDYNQAGLTGKAITITDFCDALLDYSKAIIVGAAQGVAEGLIGVAQDVVEHPIKTLIAAAAGEYIVAYQLCKMLYNVAEIGVTTLCDPSEGAQKWNDYIEPINKLVTALYNKEISLQSSVTGVTQFAVN